MNHKELQSFENPDIQETENTQNTKDILNAENMDKIGKSESIKNSAQEPVSSEEQPDSGSHAWDILCLTALLILVIICTYLIVH